MSWLALGETADDELAEGEEEDVSIVLLCSRNAAGVHFFSCKPPLDPAIVSLPTPSRLFCSSNIHRRKQNRRGRRRRKRGKMLLDFCRTHISHQPLIFFNSSGNSSFSTYALHQTGERQLGATSSFYLYFLSFLDIFFSFLFVFPAAGLLCHVLFYLRSNAHVLGI